MWGSVPRPRGHGLSQMQESDTQPARPGAPQTIIFKCNLFFDLELTVAAYYLPQQNPSVALRTQQMASHLPLPLVPLLYPYGLICVSLFPIRQKGLVGREFSCGAQVASSPRELCRDGSQAGSP